MRKLTGCVLLSNYRAEIKCRRLCRVESDAESDQLPYYEHSQRVVQLHAQSDHPVRLFVCQVQAGAENNNSLSICSCYIQTYLEIDYNVSFSICKMLSLMHKLIFTSFLI